MTLEQRMEHMRKAFQMFAATITDEQAMEVAAIYDEWKASRAYKAGDRVVYGTNAVGDPQLYNVVSDHTSQADWTPDVVPSLYTAIGLDDAGYPMWAQPTGAHDAYNMGDIVNYNGTLYQSLVDGNIWAPDAYPAGWTQYLED